MDEELPAEVRAYVDALAAEVDAEFAVQLNPADFREIDLCFASTGALERSWEHGKIAAEIRWGTDGSMKRCIAKARKYMRDPGGYCATRHKHATGQWPTEGGKAGIPS
jgi:hypothetical protein